MGEQIRSVYIIRHAKSSWSNLGQSDYDRPLNERGKRDAPRMGKLLKSLNIKPDIIVSSTAKRAAQTAKKISKEIDYDINDIKWVEKLYHCSPAVFEEVLYELDESIKSVFIVAHNPGVTDFINDLSPTFQTENMPTCGIVGAEFELSNWNEFGTVEKRVILFEYPKKNI